jgi:hypothetical protein
MPWLPYGEQDRVIINSHNFTSVPWTPALITTQLWLDAADATTLYDSQSGGSLSTAGGAVQRWQDKSGNSRHAVRASGSGNPTRQTSIINSKDVVRHNQQWFDIPHNAAFNGDTGLSLFAVFQTSSAGNNRGLIGKWSPGGGLYALVYQNNAASRHQFTARNAANSAYSSAVGPTAVTNTPAILHGRFDATAANVSSATNAGTASTTAIVGLLTSASFPLRIGSYGGDTTTALIGDLAEAIITTGSQTTDTQNRIEGYLAHKWGTTASLPALHPYKTVAP